MKKNVTRKDVAKMADVSEATVSYVINNTKNITPEVKQRVLDAIKALDYHPNLLAKSLVTKETKHIAMLVDNIQNPHYGRILRGVQHVAEEKGYIVSILSANYSSKAAMFELISRGVDGVILAVGSHTKDYSDLSLPMAMENSTLGISYRQAIFDMIETFHGLGHRRIAFLSGIPLEHPSHPRLHDLQDAMGCYRMDACPGLFINGTGVTDENAGYEATDRLLARGEVFTGIFAINDLMAIGAMKRLWEAGLKVPDDVSVAGCDGISNTAYTIPPLSTIQSHAFTLGSLLMHQLLAEMHPERELPPARQTIQAEFIRRESIGKASRGNLPHHAQPIFSKKQNER